jgi:hypothetical protein
VAQEARAAKLEIIAKQRSWAPRQRKIIFLFSGMGLLDLKKELWSFKNPAWWNRVLFDS